MPSAMFPGLARRLRADGVDGIPHARRKIAGGLRPRQLRVRARGENGVSAGEGRRRHYAESLRAVHERAPGCPDRCCGGGGGWGGGGGGRPPPSGGVLGGGGGGGGVCGGVLGGGGRGGGGPGNPGP